MKKLLTILTAGAMLVSPASVMARDSFSFHLSLGAPVQYERWRPAPPPPVAREYRVREAPVVYRYAPDIWREVRIAEAAADRARDAAKYAADRAERLEREACAAERCARESERRARWDHHFRKEARRDAAQAREARIRADCAARDAQSAQVAYEQARCRAEEARDRAQRDVCEAY